MKIVGIAGQQRTGKDTIADYIAPILGWERDSLARSVKDIYCETFQKDRAFLEEWKVKKGVIPPGFDMDVRKSLQFIGDGFRKIRGDIWIDRCFQNMTEDSTKIISDVRYINELTKVNNMDGITILVWRPDFENDDPNESEAQIRPLADWFRDTGEEGEVVAQRLARCCNGHLPEECLKVDLFIRNDGTAKQLYEKCDRIVIPYLRKKYGLDA